MFRSVKAVHFFEFRNRKKLASNPEKAIIRQESYENSLNN